MFDTIVVSAHVSDETKLTSVVVSLNNSDNSLAQNPVSVGIQGKDFTFSIKYVLTEYRLTTGSYNISITAGDGTNSHQSTASVFIVESPTVKTGYYIAGSSQPKNITKYDLSFNSAANISVNTGYNGMAYGGYNQQLFVNGNTNQSYQTFDSQTNSLSWSLPYSGGGLPQFMGVCSDGKKPYVSMYTGNVVSYSEAGVISKTYSNSAAGYYNTYFSFGAMYDLGIFKDKFGTGPDKIISFGANTGVVQNSNIVPFKVVGIFEYMLDEFYILGNDASNNAVYSLYTASTNVCTPPTSLMNGKMLSAVQIDSDYMIFSSANGNIYGFRYSNTNILSLAGVVAQKLFYHPKMHELTASCKNNLYAYSVSGNYILTQQNMHVLADSIIGFEVITNK
jgi:hypothetical protein